MPNGKNKPQSIDVIQKELADQVFDYASDSKKAAGRAIGTLVEIVTYYTLCAWGLSDHVVIERRVPEFGNSEINHNVEFSLHPIRSKHKVTLCPLSLPITPAKIRSHLPFLADQKLKNSQILSNNSIKRNAAVLIEMESGPIVANIETLDDSQCTLGVCDLSVNHFAIVECKRVGVQEGMKKGPQTIEKAKQGAYVARSVSSLQKIRLRNGEIRGVIEQPNGEFHSGPYCELLKKIIDSPSSIDYPGFVLTIGIVSNHGNWFTSDNQNKELRVLAQSYDWLLFLTDFGLSKFINDLLINPSEQFAVVKEAFVKSYPKKKGANRFTKVNIDVDADKALQKYFCQHNSDIENWFNILSPLDSSLGSLQKYLHNLANRDW